MTLDRRSLLHAHGRSAEGTRVVVGLRAWSSFLEKMMKLQFATALAAAGLLAACQPANELAPPKDATLVAAPAAPTALALESTGPTQDAGLRAAEPARPLSPEAPPRRPAQTPPESQPQPAPMPDHDMSTMPDMDHSPN